MTRGTRSITSQSLSVSKTNAGPYVLRMCCFIYWMRRFLWELLDLVSSVLRFLFNNRNWKLWMLNSVPICRCVVLLHRSRLSSVMLFIWIHGMNFYPVADSQSTQTLIILKNTLKKLLFHKLSSVNVHFQRVSQHTMNVSYKVGCILSRQIKRQIQDHWHVTVKNVLQNVI